MFQSLVGFKINWNASSSDYVVVRTKFQSLVGFKINWNSSGINNRGSLSFVSIPSRV